MNEKMDDKKPEDLAKETLKLIEELNYKYCKVCNKKNCKNNINCIQCNCQF